MHFLKDSQGVTREENARVQIIMYHSEGTCAEVRQHIYTYMCLTFFINFPFNSKTLNVMYVFIVHITLEEGFIDSLPQHF